MTKPDHISVDDFFEPPVRAGAQISPDGTRVAYLAPWRDRMNIWVASLEADGEFGADARRVTSDETRSVLHFSWTNDPRWLLYLQDAGGDENWHVMRVDLDAPEAHADDLTPFPGAMNYYEVLADKPGKAIVGSNRRGPTHMDAYELDIATGELTLLAENPGDVIGWLSSRRGDLFATKLNDDGDVEVLQWNARTQSLRSIAEYDGKDYTMGIYPMTVTPDGSGIWMGSNEGTDRTRLVRLDVADGKQYAVDSHPTFDIDTRAQVWAGLPEPLIQSRATGELLGVRYLGERQVIRALDPTFADVLAGLRKLSDGDVAALSSDTGGTKWIVTFNHDREPGVTYFYDHDTGERRELYRP